MLRARLILHIVSTEPFVHSSNSAGRPFPHLVCASTVK